MNSSKKDYLKLYRLQDKFLDWWHSLNLPFYLTGGTALGRFYLNHRFSEYLDFFVNADANYQQYIAALKSEIASRFSLSLQQSLFTEDFTRFFITDEDVFLKIELVNDVPYYPGKPAGYPFGIIDTPLNILSNKLIAIVGRDEPKDIFDIIQLSLNYEFNWMNIFEHTKQKAVINELDIEQRLASFPVGWLENVNWLFRPIEPDTTRKNLNQIAGDFLWGRQNSLGAGKIPIEMAKPCQA